MGKSLFSMLCRSSATRTTSEVWSRSPAYRTCAGLRRQLPVARQPASVLRTGRESSLGDRLVERALEVADLVPQLGRVLEAELLGRGQHLLLEGHDRLL